MGFLNGLSVGVGIGVLFTFGVIVIFSPSELQPAVTQTIVITVLSFLLIMIGLLSEYLDRLKKKK